MNQLQEIATLREKVDELTEENRQLREAMYGPLPPLRHLLTPSEGRLLSGLYRASGVATREALCIAISDDMGECHHKVLDVLICKIRKKLAPHGVEIQTVRNVGFELVSSSRAIIDAMLASNVRERDSFKRVPMRMAS